MKHKTMITTKWVFNNKVNEGHIIINKEILVCNGYA